MWSRSGSDALAADERTSSPRDARMYFWIFTLLSAIVMFAPIRAGDLAGYDDARYSIVAKDIVQTGNWMDIRVDGGPALEHPPLFPWMQAVLFSVFGLSDTLAKLPSAFCGFLTILLTGWLARRLTRDPFQAVLAMFVMATSIYFLKYAARAMTDVPFTFFFLCAVCAWMLSEDDPRWYLAVGLFIAMAQMTRAMMGLAVPVLFAADWSIRPRRIPLHYLVAALGIAFLPPLAWYAQWIYRYGATFFAVHSAFLHDEVYGQLSPAWRRYTGAPEYLWMISKSYWPWLPAMIAGLVAVVRAKVRRLHFLLLWVAVVFSLCAITRSRVLRYMLPAYPAFSILSAIGILAYVRERVVRTGLRALTPVLAAGVLAIAIWPPVNWHAAETRPMALAATAATKPGELITFYDAGQPRYDETNELLWYGDRFIVAVWDSAKLADALQRPRSRVFVVDADTFRTHIESRIPNQVVARTAHLVCVSLSSPIPEP
jgi:4-amino-4-deoxy-L-arabinose transferase-like glycosyltransferase